MKKYLLTALLGVFGFVGAFASADNITTITSDGSSYTPTTITFSSDYVITEDIVSSVSCESECNITIINPASDNYDCSIDYTWYSDDDNGHFEWYISNDHNECSFTAGTYNIYKQQGTNYFDSISFVIPFSGGGDNSSSSDSPLLSGGTSVFTSIISSLTTSINEFIPYVVYIGIGLLGSIIGFVAIKRLLNRLRAKIFGTFSGGRRR